jgi:hypothetical protein
MARRSLQPLSASLLPHCFLPIPLIVPPCFSQVANSATDSQRRHPKPVGMGVAIDATQTSGPGGKGGKKGKGGGEGPAEDDAL